MTTFRYSWRRRVPDQEWFDGFDGKLLFAHVRLLTMGSDEGQWDWSLSGLSFGYRVGGHMAGTAREAAAHAENEYDRLLPESEGLHLRAEEEVAHYEERGIKLPPMVQWRKAVHVDHSMTMAEANAMFRPDYEPPSTSTTHSRRSR
jgi:hypothetical protein